MFFKMFTEIVSYILRRIKIIYVHVLPPNIYIYFFVERHIIFPVFFFLPSFQTRLKYIFYDKIFKFSNRSVNFHIFPHPHIFFYFIVVGSQPVQNCSSNVSNKFISSSLISKSNTSEFSLIRIGLDDFGNVIYSFCKLQRIRI